MIGAEITHFTTGNGEANATTGAYRGVMLPPPYGNKTPKDALWRVVDMLHAIDPRDEDEITMIGVGPLESVIISSRK